MQHNRLFVFDIETIPDEQAAHALMGETSTDVQQQRKALADYHLDITDGRSDFLRQPFHKVVALSYLDAEIQRNAQGETYILKDIRTGGELDSSEKDIVNGFWQFMERSTPRLVSYNGRSFDLPVLKYRAMKHGITAAALFKSGDKWNSYTQRYSLDWHCDLLEALSDFGASARCKLNEVCSIMGFPGKFGVDGSKVSQMYDDGQLEEIRDYCETDVLNTYLVYLRYQHHTGTLSTENYNTAIKSVIDFIKEHQGQRAHFAEFYQAWEAACSGAFYL